jgi:hypothetical protein
LLIVGQNHYIIAIVTEFLAKEPLDVAGVIDTTPQRGLLSNIVDPDAEGFLPPVALRVSEKWLLLLRSLKLGTVILLPEWWTGRGSS